MKISEFLNENIKISDSFNTGKYKQRNIMKDNVSIGKIRYKMIGETLIIDMLTLDVESERRKGYASKTLSFLINKLNPKKVTSSEDGFTEEGEALFQSVADKMGKSFNNQIIESIYGNEIEVPKYVYHSSHPINRKSIIKKGIIPKKGERLLDDGKGYKKGIYASIDKDNLFDDGYNNDVWKIDATQNKWIEDLNMKNSIVTFTSIKKDNIQLMHSGSGEDLWK